MAAEKIGRITQVIGAVLDIRFQAGELPLINEAIRIKREDGGELVAEVSQHLGDDTVRCIAMGSTDGLRRGMEAIATLPQHRPCRKGPEGQSGQEDHPFKTCRRSWRKIGIPARRHVGQDRPIPATTL